MENQGVRADRREVERFVGQLREFSGNVHFDRRARRTGRLVLGAALLGTALLLLTACGRDTGSASLGASDSSLSASPSPSATATSSPTASPSPSSTTTLSPTASPDSTTQESTIPISQGCQPPDMENCYGYEDMQEYLDQIIPPVEQFFDTAYADMPHPAEYIYVPEGDTGPTGCTDGYADDSYMYCPEDQTIYTGQRTLWKLYSDAGDAAPAVGLAHEWGHHVQNVVGVPPAQTTVGQISRENQADCIAGAWVAYADKQGLLNYPDDLYGIDAFLAIIAEDEPGRSHGDLGERSDSLKLGIGSSLQGCNDFFPDSPVIATSSASPSPSSTATASSSASSSASPSSQ